MTQPPILPGPPPPTYAPAPPPKKKGLSTGWIITIILVPLALLALCGAGILLATGAFISDQKQAKGDVSITDCGQDSFAMLAVVRVVNSTDHSVSYSVTVAFESSDGTQLDTGSAYISSVAPGQAATDEVRGFAAGDASPARCVVKDVTRV